ncbi:MAG: hypothetical protein ABI072_05365 [Edaphobacter sp.]
MAAVLFGVVAVAAFWCAVQLFWSVRGKRWYSALVRVAGAMVLIVFGVLMVFYTAFGADVN